MFGVCSGEVALGKNGTGNGTGNKGTNGNVGKNGTLMLNSPKPHFQT